MATAAKINQKTLLEMENQCQQRLFSADLCVILNLRSSYLAKPGTQINTVKEKSRFNDYWRTLTSPQLLSNQCRWDASVWVPQLLMCKPLNHHASSNVHELQHVTQTRANQVPGCESVPVQTHPSFQYLKWNNNIYQLDSIWPGNVHWATEWQLKYSSSVRSTVQDLQTHKYPPAFKHQCWGFGSFTTNRSESLGGSRRAWRDPRQTTRTASGGGLEPRTFLLWGKCSGTCRCLLEEQQRTLGKTARN